MPFPRPTLAEIRNQIRQDLQSGALPGVLSVARYSVLNVFASVWAGIAHLHYGYIDWIAKQGVPWTADDENLEGWANLKGISRKTASFASGEVTFQASSGGIIPAGTSIQIAGAGTVVTSGPVTASNGSVTVAAVAQSAGSAGNAGIGCLATLLSPVAGVQSQGAVTAPFTGGAETEKDEDFRGRMLAAFSRGGENGSERDYVNWALSVPGVTRAWCHGNGFGAGTVVVYIMLDGSGGYPVGSDGSATGESRYQTATGDQLRVADIIQPLRPVTALVIICSPIRQNVDFVISGLGSDNTPQNQQRITQALSGAFRDSSVPGGTIWPNAWLEALSGLGLRQYAVTTPVTAIRANSPGHMPDLGQITFNS